MNKRQATQLANRMVNEASNIQINGIDREPRVYSPGSFYVIRAQDHLTGYDFTVQSAEDWQRRLEAKAFDAYTKMAYE